MRLILLDIYRWNEKRRTGVFNIFVTGIPKKLLQFCYFSSLACLGKDTRHGGLNVARHCGHDGQTEGVKSSQRSIASANFPVSTYLWSARGYNH